MSGVTEVWRLRSKDKSRIYKAQILRLKKSAPGKNKSKTGPCSQSWDPLFIGECMAVPQRMEEKSARFPDHQGSQAICPFRLQRQIIHREVATWNSLGICQWERYTGNPPSGCQGRLCSRGCHAPLLPHTAGDCEREHMLEPGQRTPSFSRQVLFGTLAEEAYNASWRGEMVRKHNQGNEEFPGAERQ